MDEEARITAISITPDKAATAPDLERATLRRRLASMLYEALLMLGVLGLGFMVPNLVLGVVWQISVPGWAAWLHLFLLMGLYFVWYWVNGGQTLAMQTWRVRLVDAVRGGAPVPVSRALLRYLLSWPSLLFFGAGLLWALLDRDRQFLHDRLAGTRVVFLGPQRNK
ncbi:MAG: RDD family protein [Rhodocyclaceae bacterium]|nr:RDD family protein [Rhodocyclaceae bacterium]